MDIYAEMIANGQEVFNHESDLYVYANPITSEIIKRYEFKENITKFTSQTDKKPMYDIPFAYTPFWNKRKRTDTI